MSTGVKNQNSISVLFFSHSSQLAGAERSLLGLVKQLIEDHQFTCSVVLPDEGPLRERLEEVGASTSIINYYWWCDSTQLPPEEIEARFISSLTNIGNKLNNINKLNPDIIFSNTLSIQWGAVTALLLGKPHVWFVHEFGELDHTLKFHLPFQTVIRIIEESSNYVLYISDAVRNTLFGDNPPENILPLCYYIEIPSDAINEEVTSYFTKKESVKLIISGTIMPSKGQSDAILAVKELIRRKFDVELAIMGPSEPAYLEQIKEMVKSNDLEPYIKSIDFRANPYPVVNQADIVLVCSRMEAFGRVTLEAMLLKKPVIGTNTGGTPEQVKEGYNGLLYTPGDYHQLADKIGYLIDHREKIKEFGENGYKFAKETFTKEKSGGRLSELLRKLKGAPSPSSASLLQSITKSTLDSYINLRSVLDTKELQVAECHSEIASLQEQIAESHSKIASVQSQIASLQEQIVDIKVSASWRLTRPLRFIGSFFHTIVRILSGR